MRTTASQLPLQHGASVDHARPNVARANLRVDATRTVVLCGDLADREDWDAGLQAEGLSVYRAHTPPGAGPTGAATPAVHAVVWRVSRCVTEHLFELRSLRRRWPDVPLLVACTAGRDLDHVLALEIGADDVLDAAWPVSVVAARLRSQWRQALRWRDEQPEPQELHFGQLLLRRSERAVLLDQQPVLLTDGEFDVLWMLASRAGEAVSRTDMLRRIRGTSDPFVDRSIDSRVYRIRRKLGDCERATPRMRGSGYLFSPSGW
jgi:DNA-binding response OmpR family regulator